MTAATASSSPGDVKLCSTKSQRAARASSALPLDLGEPRFTGGGGGGGARLADDVHAKFPELNVLIANAGISRREDVTADRWDEGRCRGDHRNEHPGRAARDGGFPTAGEKAAECDNPGDRFAPGIPASCRFSNLLREQSLPAFLAHVAASPTPKHPGGSTRALAALCANGTDRRPAGCRSPRHADR